MPIPRRSLALILGCLLASGCGRNERGAMNGTDAGPPAADAGDAPAPDAADAGPGDAGVPPVSEWDAATVEDAGPRGDGGAPDAGGPSSAVQLEVSATASCARLASGRLRCWGEDWGGLGRGALGVADPHVVGIDDAVDVSVGLRVGCATDAAGAVSCWGRPEYGSLGFETRADEERVDTARAVTATRGPVVALSVGHAHACAVQVDGTVRCWGGRLNRECSAMLGTDPVDLGPEGVTVEGIDDAVDVASGPHGSCVIHETGRVSCWGCGPVAVDPGTEAGERGHTRTPLPVDGIEDAVKLSVGLVHACAIEASGRLLCWGRGSYGRLATGGNDPEDFAPRPFAGIEDARDVAVGFGFTCVVRDSGRVSCVGQSGWGTLGRESDRLFEPELEEVAGLEDVIALDSFYHSCALRDDGRVFCWGVRGDVNRLGDGLTRGYSAEPVEVTDYRP